MGITPDLHDYPLCHFFVGKYVLLQKDPTNFPENHFPEVFGRYENLFGSALETLATTKEALKRRAEFNFDSGDANNLERGIATLRVVEALSRTMDSLVASVTKRDEIIFGIFAPATAKLLMVDLKVR